MHDAQTEYNTQPNLETKVTFDEQGFAQNSGLLGVYHYDSYGEFTGESEEWVSQGGGLPANCTALAPLKKKKGYAVIFNKKTWGYVKDNRGKHYFSTETGEEITITTLGELPQHITEQPRPSEYHTWNGTAWDITPEALQAQLAETKTQRLNELNQYAANLVEQLAQTNKTPEFERATWNIQRDEAEKWFADNSYPTPNLDRIAQMRGIPAEILRQKAYEKSQQYQMLTMTIAGQRQKYEDRIEQATTLEELQAIAFDISVQGGA